MKINDIIKYDYINNYSDIITYSKNNDFIKLFNSLKGNNILVKSHLIHKQNQISIQEQFIFNLDNYISFIKSFLKIEQLQIRYLLELTLYNSSNNILYSNIYFYDNKEYYIKNFKKLFMSKYIKNYNILKKYINIKKYNFDELVNKLNKIKNKAHFYFEDINKNLPYYIEIIDYLEKTSNI